MMQYMMFYIMYTEVYGDTYMKVPTDAANKGKKPAKWCILMQVSSCTFSELQMKQFYEINIPCLTL